VTGAPPPSGALGAFAWLIARSARNRARAQLRRLREPRYALGFALAAGYLWLVYLRPRRSVIDAAGLPPLVNEGIVLAFSLLLFVLAAWWWIVGAPRTALAFTPAEVQLLFPAPLVRRELILYKLMRAHAGMLVMSLIFGILLRRGLGDVPVAMRAFGLFVMYAILHLHQLGISLSREGLAGRGAGRARSFIPLAVFLGLLATLVVSVSGAYDATPSPGADRWGARAVEAFRARGAWLVLLPARVALAPAFAASVGDWVRAIGPAILLLLAHYAWVLRADAAFEESAAAAGAERARRIAARRGGRPRAAVRAPGRLRLPLALTGPPERAVVWKNTLAFVRTFEPGALAAVAIGAAALVFVGRGFDAQMGGRGDYLFVFAQGGALVAAALLTLFGPLRVRNDLRLDLAHAEVVRTFPLDGRALVRAELAASTLALSAMQLALVAIAYALSLVHAPPGFPLGERTLLLLALAVILPTVNATTLALQNAGALLFPAWTALGAVRGPGLEALGQGILGAVASLLLTLLALFLPVLVGGAAAALLRSSLGDGSLAAGLAAALAVAWTQVGLVVRWLGGVFERGG
jgi:hypothetical protein